MPPICIRNATPADVPAIVRLIRELAQYERLAAEAMPDEGRLREHLFGSQRYCEVDRK